MRNMSFYLTVTLPRKELTITNSPNQITHCTLYQITKHYARFNMCNKQSLYRRPTEHHKQLSTYLRWFATYIRRLLVARCLPFYLCKILLPVTYTRGSAWYV